MHKTKHARSRLTGWAPRVLLSIALITTLFVSFMPLAATQGIDLRVLREMTHVPSRDWESDIAAIERRYANFDTEGGAIVFIGSSSINRWTTLADDFPGHPVINAGFGGSQIVDSIVYTDRLIVPFAPHTVVMFAGSNDISAGKPPTRVLDDYIAFVEGVHGRLPSTQIVFISITPSESRWSQHPRVMEANALIKAYTETDERLHFVDIYESMLGEDGRPDPNLYVADRLHLSRAGYEVWIEALQPYFNYPFQRVWLDGPTTSQALATPVTIRALVSPELAPQHVRISVGDAILYEGTTAPDDALSTGYLSDGSYDVVLYVVDGQGEVWQRKRRLHVANAFIVQPTPGAIVGGTVRIVPTTGFASDMVEQALITLIPLRHGLLQHDEAITVFQGQQLPADLSLNTLALDDAAYELQLHVVTTDGKAARHTQPLIVRNWERLEDDFLPPQQNAWFGAIDRKKTVFESSGWDYAADGGTAFFGDDSRRVWTGAGEGVLQWDVPRLHHVTATLYFVSGKTPQVSFSVSSDGEHWQPLPTRLTAVEAGSAGWDKAELNAQAPTDDALRYLRLTVADGMTKDVLQLGQVGIVSRSGR